MQNVKFASYKLEKNHISLTTRRLSIVNAFYYARRNATDYCIGGNILCNDSPRRNYRIVTNSYPRKYYGARPYPNSVSNANWFMAQILALFRIQIVV